jgi:uncharacterized protein YfbU (UPF0304 family)
VPFFAARLRLSNTGECRSGAATRDDPRINLTKTERLALANQFLILAKLDSGEAGHYARMVEILERGYVREYPSLVDRFSEELSAETSEEVVSILRMHRALNDAYTAFEDKCGFDADKVAFQGFDGNTEGRHLSYACFLVHERGHWQEFKNAGSDPSSRGDLNSHCSTLWRYRPMLVRWKASANPDRLTREDIIRIVGP